jgi:hypothetical protein
MRKCMIAGSALLATATLLWSSSDPWKSKPYQQWDQKDIQKILQDSPWAKIVRVDVGWESPGASSAPVPGAPGTNGGDQGPVVARSGGMGGASAPAPSESGGGMRPGGMQSGGMEGGVRQAVFVVRWVSSRTLREALLRGAVLNGQMKQEDAEKDLAQVSNVYQVVVAGPQMTPFETTTEEDVKKGAFLTTKQNKQKIEASKVEFQRSPDGSAVRAVIISFPKTTATGEPTIGLDEKGAELSVTAGRSFIRTNFDLSKMDDAQGRDL